MSKLSSSNHTVERLVTHLEHSGLIKGLDLSDEDIADAIWLTLQMGVVEIEIAEEQSNSSEPEDQVIINEIEETPISDLDYSETNSTVEVYEQEAINQDFEVEETPKGFPFQAPAAPAIQNKLLIGRALRPLMRKVSSSTRTVIDAEATVNRIAEQNIWLPVTKPEPERWLDLELVVEESRSSFIWTETVDELQQLLQNHGAFRTVRVWIFSSTDSRYLELSRRRKGNQKSHYKHSYRELIHSNKRGLILIVSDCTSNIWQQKNIYECLHKLSNKLPTAIMQLFPERLWQSSGLGLGYKLQFSAFNPGVPNSKLVLPSLWEELETEQILKLPVVTLEAFSLGQWSKVLIGFGNTRTPGFVFDLEFLKEQFAQQANERPINQQSITDNSQEIRVEELAEEVVDRFLATASPTAQKLAGLMAAAPISLAVVNLIRRQFLPYKSTPVNIAEVFLSGMIERTNTSGNNTSHSEPQYDFIPGVRKLLNKATRLGETENVLDKLSEYIVRELGLPSSIKTFSALLIAIPRLKAGRTGKNITLCSDNNRSITKSWG
ncbi:MAG: SAV_2336 N-terminal domain-related protein [Mastigocoleus sp. MO_167.B18]|nr:SAV_2336 N-terminal domain-related protein [Mastigocoleus sp. MO_167.B18]